MGEIARIFFPPGESSSYTSGGRPSYAAPGTGYGPPSQSPTGPYYPSSFYYQGFEDDIFLLIKLSHVALIVFIIFAIVTMIYLVVSCCVSFTRRREKDVSGPAPQPFLIPQAFSGGEGKNGGVTRSGGVENLAETGSSSGTDDGVTTLGRGRSRSRGRSTGRGVEEADTPRFLGPQITRSQTADLRPGLGRQAGEADKQEPIRRLTNQSSTASDISNPRSLPYYEVPSSRMPLPGPFTTFSQPPASPPPPLPTAGRQATVSTSRLI